ncbi:Dolichyl-phosphate-mannose-protein mannosyltransferase [Leuconostoc mesenteroides]|uniref:ArnT family glycosyltransferase n=1 Tax=Leuconostoc mesenteroides TaxID=1245 RepID=UPI000CFA04D4|nr:glycosyltransferase family 39 protein [Leuconostoc mesenteroides]SPE15351.1 Dolichyl-phosphate-mannose-protein mannosyltransferase [Leuconostoc mesenteroides]SPI60373.1 Dolichyl-phosphate-mannose-protein mannosyltransferase [Leuconostoc mesenteroides]
MQLKRMQKTDWYLVGILILSAFLYGWGIWDAGSANSYYTAAITSMTKSWSNFWYGAFDPAGFITVDKPPVALWLMAISAKIFGVHGWSVVLPSVLSGIGSVYLMYKLLAPKFGLLAGRIGSLILTLTPTVVANSRTNNMDAILVFFLLLAVYILQKAVAKKNIWLVIVSFGLIGVGFNIKMLQAFMILPAMLVYYWVAIKLPWKKKIAWLVVGMASLSIFTVAYPLAVDSVDQSSRPYIGSSQTNSLMELAFGYNGTERLLGQSTGTGGAFPGMGSTKKSTGTQKNNGAPSGKKPSGSASTGKMTGQAPTGQQNGGKAPTGTPPNQSTNKNANQAKGKAPGQSGKMTRQAQGGQGGGNSAFAIGSAGPFRLFQSDLGSQIGWYLPLAILGLIAGWFGFRKRGAKWHHVSEEQSEVLLWAGWFVPVYGFFSVASFFHPYYTIMLAPAIAALTAIGVAAVVKMSAQSNKESMIARIVVSVAVLTTLLLQAYYVWSYYQIISIILIIVAIGLSIWWLLPRQINNKIKIVLSAISILLMAGWWSLTPTLSHNSAAIPAASPSLLSQTGSSDMGGEVNDQLLSYTKKHQGNAKYLFATTDSNSASGYIIKSGKAVMAIGGYNGTDPTMSLSEFKKLVKSGQLKYFVMGNNSKTSSGQISKILTWVKKNGTKVTYSSSTSNQSSPTQQMGGQSQSTTLYDLSNIYE